jgi:diaminopropionate ammonia-lyase
MNRLARPSGADPAIVAGESGGVGLAGLVRALADPSLRDQTGLGAASRVFVINTEGATDPDRYRELVGKDPAAVTGAAEPASDNAAADLSIDGARLVSRLRELEAIGRDG